MKKFVAVLSIVIVLALSLAVIRPLWNFWQPNNSRIQAYAIPIENDVPGSYVNGTKLVNRLLQSGVTVYWLAEPLEIKTTDGSDYLLNSGDFIIPANQKTTKFGFSTFIPDAYIRGTSTGLNVTVLEVNSPFEASVYPLKDSRVAVYYGNGCTGGSLEHVYPLEEAGFDVDVITPADIQSGVLNSYDVVTFPGGGPYLDQFNEIQTRQIRDFVRLGGDYLGSCGGSILGVQLGLLDVQMVSSEQEFTFAAMRGPIVLETSSSTNPVTFGFKDSFKSDYFYGSFVNQVGSNVTVVATLRSSTSNLREYIPEVMKAYNFTRTVNIDDYWGRPAIVTGKYGAGKVLLSTVHPEVLPEAHRIFTNAIYFLSNGEKTLIKIPLEEKEPSYETYLGSATRWNEATYSRINEQLQTLEREALNARLVLSNFEIANNEMIGSNGEYLGFFLSDLNSRSTQLLSDLSELRDDYNKLEELKNTLAASSTSATGNESRAIYNLQGKIASILDAITNLEASIRQMDIIKEELATEEQNIRQIQVSSNFSLTERYERIIDLQKNESQTLNKAKEIDYYLLRWSFQAKTILTETDFLIALCKEYGSATSAVIS